jgi:putative transposase
MCRVLEVSPSGYYEWRDRKPSRCAMENAVLVEQIRQIHDESDGTYGMPRVRAELVDRGARVARQRVARLIRCHGIRRRCALPVSGFYEWARKANSKQA